MSEKFRWKWRILSLLAAVLVGVGMLSVSALAEGEETGSGTESGEESSLSYLALGDSITDGYGLAAPGSESFVTLFAEAIGATEVNQISSSDGLTASQLLEDLNDSNIYAETYQEAVESSDVITITIGGNDLMEGFYEVVVEIYSESTGITINADLVKTALKDPDANSEMVDALLAYINSLADDVLGDGQFATYISNCISDINQITGFIQEKNPDAVILVANQYNPYQWLGNEKVSNLFADVTDAYNSNLAYLSAYYGRFTVVDISSAFAESTSSLTNASATITSIDFSTGTYSISYDFDFHPNAAGHEVIAAAMAEAYETVVSESEEPGSGTESGGESGDESGLSYLALGDSITTGYGLGEGESSFVELYAEAIEAEATIIAEDGLTAAELYAELVDAETYVSKYQNAVENADVITITIGGNDLMETFYEAVAYVYNERYSTDYQAEQIKALLQDADANSELVTQLLGILAQDEVVAYLRNSFANVIPDVASKVAWIASSIKAVNGDAVVLVANQYNPYQWIANYNSQVSELFDTVVSSYNTYLDYVAAAMGNIFTVVDIYSAFADEEYADTSLTNASVSISFDPSTGISYSFDFDFHPNATGHEVIAKAMLSAYAGSQGEEGTVYTVTIPIELIVEVAGSAAAPEENFHVQAGIYYYDEASGGSGLMDVSASLAGATYSENEVSTDGEETYSGILTFTCSEELLSSLSDGFYVSLVSGDSAGWTYADEEYQICYMDFDEYGVLSEYTVYSAEDEFRESELPSVSFTCTYTGYTLSFDTNEGSAIDSVEDAAGTVISLADYTPDRDGYTFNGWYSDEALTEPVESVILTTDKTVYAGWTEVSQGTDDTPDDDDDNSDDNSDSSDDTSDEATEETTETKVTEEIAETEVTEETTTATPTESEDTGDSSSIALWAVLAIVLGAGMAAVTVNRRRENQ
ncbi:MAG: GDSL-type esterase/lipase family protein [Lachnospiraceae bacterium]|nr:GDSL-type esterase/lipase family protein [Lachnospiraceae bacterium]